MKIAMSPRITGLFGQYIVNEHPLVILSIFILWISLKAKPFAGTSLKKGVGL
jgi:hypothetical protein